MWETKEENFYSTAETMAALLNYINRTYGSVMQYISSIGVSQDTIEKIRQKLLK